VVKFGPVVPFSISTEEFGIENGEEGNEE
jgi:hypothetical protein